MTTKQGRLRAGVALVALGAFAAAGGVARADERDDLIRELRERLDAQAAEQSRMRAEIDALKAGGQATDREALRSAIDEILRETPGTAAGAGIYRGPSGVERPSARLQIGGYFSTLYRNQEADGKYGSFVDNRLVTQIHAEVSRFVQFDSEVEIEHGGVGGGADGEVVVEYAQVKFQESECFALKAGTILLPWGRFNLEHDDPLNDLSTRPTVSRMVNGTVFALPGIGVEGVLAPSEDLTVTYDFAVTNGLKDEILSGSGIRGARGLFEDDDNHGKTVFGRFGFVPETDLADALSLGTSFAWGNVGTEGRGEHDLRGYGVDAAGKWGAWEMKGEWSHLGVDRDASAAPPGNRTALGPVRGLSGWYAQGLYRIREDWVRRLPFAEESASVALVLRRDVTDLNDRVKGADAADDERAWTFGVNYRPSTKTVVKLEYRKAESSFPGEEGEDRDAIVLEFATYF